MARVAVIHCVLTDVFGDDWDAKPPIETAHSWGVYKGWPHGWPRGRGGVGGPRWIVTEPLAEYLEATRVKDIDLPIGTTPVKRMRQWIGLHWQDERKSWWENHIVELASISNAEFARRYDVLESSVSVFRAKLIGKKQRENDWWRKGEPAELLAGKLPAAYVADKLGIAVGSVRRLRHHLAKSG